MNIKASVQKKNAHYAQLSNQINVYAQNAESTAYIL